MVFGCMSLNRRPVPFTPSLYLTVNSSSGTQFHLIFDKISTVCCNSVVIFEFWWQKHICIILKLLKNASFVYVKVHISGGDFTYHHNIDCAPVAGVSHTHSPLVSCLPLCCPLSNKGKYKTKKRKGPIFYKLITPYLCMPLSIPVKTEERVLCSLTLPWRNLH